MSNQLIIAVSDVSNEQAKAITEAVLRNIYADNYDSDLQAIADQITNGEPFTVDAYEPMDARLNLCLSPQPVYSAVEHWLKLRG